MNWGPDSVKVNDEFGAQWKVRGGDPAARLTNKLLRSGYQTVVLPFLTLATGKVAEPAEWPANIISRTRLADCLLAVKG